jgi:hypothetical protein
MNPLVEDKVIAKISLLIVIVFGLLPFKILAADRDLTGSRLILSPSYVSGEKNAAGFSIGLGTLNGDIPWWSGSAMLLGTVARDPAEHHAEVLYGHSFIHIAFFGGLGIKALGNKLGFQYSYGMALGPTSLSVRRYRIANKKYVEGTASLVIPITL